MHRIVKGEGPAPARVALFGEAPGRTEAKKGRPFAGQSGAVMNVSLFHAGLRRNELYVSNVYKTWLGRDAKGNDITPNDQDLAEHLPLLEQELKRVQPEIIGSIGRLATRYFLGDVTMDSVHGVPHLLDDGRVVVPIIHPAAGFRDEQMGVWSFYDFKQLGLTVRGKIAPVRLRKVRPKCKLYHAPPNYGGFTIAMDTEGSATNPFCWSMCYDGKIGYVAERANPDTDTTLNLRNCTLVLHYAVHDMPILRDLGVNVDDCNIEDTMVLAYVIGLEPKGLKELARRHLHFDMRSYREVVMPHYAKAATAYVTKANKHSWGDPGERLVFDRSTRRQRIYKPQSANRRLTSILTSKAEVLDYEKRWLSIPPDLRDPIEKRFGPFPPESDAIALVPEPDRTQYAGTDAVATHRIHSKLWAIARGLELEQVAKQDMAIIPYIERMQRNGILCYPPHFEAMLPGLVDKKQKLEKSVSSKYLGGKPINLASGPQVAHLLYDVIRLTPPRLTKKGDRGSTDKKSLAALKQLHPVIVDITQYKQADKNESFARTLPAFAGPDGRLRGRVKYTNVVSGRFAMEDPNMQQIPSRTEEGKEIRNGFLAGPGNLLLSCDYDQLEMKVMAHLANDKRLVEYIRNGLDIHSQTAAKLFGGRYEDYANEPSKEFKLRRTVTKNLNYLIVYQGGAGALLDNLVLYGITTFSIDDCRNFIRDWYGLYSGMADFQDTVKTQCRRHGHVRSMWGRIRWLPNIYSPIEYMKWEAERQCVSHVISASATDIIKRAMALLWPWLREMWRDGFVIEPLLQIHDELLFEIGRKMKWVLPVIQGLMTADSKLFRVPITVGGSIGARWGELK